MLRSLDIGRFARALLQVLDELPAVALGRVVEGVAAVKLVVRCLPHDQSPAGVERDRVVRDRLKRANPDHHVVVPSTPWEDAVIGDTVVLAKGWPEEPNARWVLTPEQYAAYSRYCDAVLNDALDRFAMDVNAAERVPFEGV